MRILIVFLTLFSTIISQAQQKDTQVSWSKLVKVKPLTESQEKNWQHLDIEKDTIPGLSFNTAYSKLLKDKKGKEVIIALLDTPVEISHKGLVKRVWVNDDEIANNNVDDDNNGYKDDVYGWNFLGNDDGEISDFQHEEYIRVYAKFVSMFSENDFVVEDSLKLKNYLKAKSIYESKLKYANEELEYSKLIRRVRTEGLKELRKYFPDLDYELGDLDSLKKQHPEDEYLQLQIKKMYGAKKYGITESYISIYEKEAKERIEKAVNPYYNERIIQNDNPNDIEDRIYGNGNINFNTDKYTHGTRVSGALGFCFYDDVVYNFTPQIKIMPLVNSINGDRHTKDIAIAIMYAVDNGAKVINMSFGKNFSLNNEWIEESITYAEKNNVLIVTSAGNTSTNLDEKDIMNFPDDRGLLTGKEIVSNFIKVGSSTRYLDKRLKSSFSSYGKENVDLFAPADSIYTIMSGNKYRFEQGTSMASAVTCSVAALLFSYYPSLKASEVKQILMDSGVEYDILVDVPTKENPDQQLPFNQLSKSGKIVNAYNAMLMAEEFVKAKKKK
ncbi:S8 family serine peptidase [Dokdonia sp.]|uniref:S8 family serine peptidase n=1 Tax=Dokdonia sp. TaxID=2024995 RepID=UPI003267BA13